MSLSLASVIVFAHLAWLANISALVVDVVPAASLGKVFGIVAAGSSAGAIVMNGLVASFLKQGSYNQWFVIADSCISAPGYACRRCCEEKSRPLC